MSYFVAMLGSLFTLSEDLLNRLRVMMLNDVLNDVDVFGWFLMMVDILVCSIWLSVIDKYLLEC